MYLELENITFKGMSNPEAFVLEEGTKSVDFQFLLRPSSEFESGCQVSTSKECNPGREAATQEEKCHLVASEQHKIQVENTEEDTAVVEEEDDDGYQTPTSSKYKITTRQCPPAPKKPRSIPLKKRKASSDTHRIRIDLSPEEIEMLFGPILADSGRKIKKARKVDMIK